MTPWLTDSRDFLQNLVGLHHVSRGLSARGGEKDEVNTRVQRPKALVEVIVEVQIEQRCPHFDQDELLSIGITMRRGIKGEKWGID